MSRPSSSRWPPRCIGSATDGAACRAASAGSERSKALDAAVGAGDVATADKLADESIGRLEGGRRQLAIAGRWAPGSAVAVAADKFFVASQALVNGKRAGAVTRDLHAGQAAFEKAGGLAAWQGMITAAGSIKLPAGTSPKP